MLLNLDKTKYTVHGDDFEKDANYILIGFKKFNSNNEYSLINNGISLVTKSIFIHTEIIYQEHNKLMMLSGSQFDGKVRKKRHRLNTTWVYYRLRVSKSFIDNMLLFYTLTENNKYDYLGILGFILFNQDRNNRWFCSEWCSNVLKINGFEPMLLLDPSNVSPGDLADMFKIENKINRIEFIKKYIL